MEKKTGYVCYRVIRWLVCVFYPKIQVIGKEKLPGEPVILVGNHAQMNGPIIGQLYPPRESDIWCAGEMMQWKEVPGYAFSDFWSRKPGYSRWFYRLLSYVITPFSVWVFNNANTIGVYRDARILSTFKNTVKVLQQGKDVIIFPEHNAPSNHIINAFQDRYIDVARLYYKRTGKSLAFVPMYIAPRRKAVYLGTPVYYRPDVDMDTQRKDITAHLMREITETAIRLPKHTVIPYRKVPGVAYSSNQEADYEKAGG